MQTVEITVDDLVYGGDGIGRMPDGRTVFVPYAIQGEVVRTRLVGEKSGYSRAELIEVLEPSPERVKPRCFHYSVCGGCHYQHISYSAQLTAKRRILAEQLSRLGGLKNIPDIRIEPSPEPYSYRNHIQFHLTQDGKLGYQKAHSHQTFAVRECHLPEEPINGLWPKINIEPGSGLERVGLRCAANGDVMLILESADTTLLDFTIEDLTISVVQISPGGNLVLSGSDYIVMEILGRNFMVSAGSFFQVNSIQANKMVEHLLGHLPLDENMTVLDLYCGVGLFSAFVAPKVKRLVGIEVFPEACEDFSVNLDEFDNVELYEAAVEDVLSSVRFNPDIVLMDPPRAGLGTRTIEGLIAQGASHLAYVSCDPATLSRDARLLQAGGYQLTQVSLIDLFPQTYHIESISYWDKVK